MLNEFGLEGSPGRPVLLRILHFPGQVASLWGSIQGIFQFFFAPPCFWFALAWPVSWGFPLCNSLPSLEDRWSSETASFVFLLTTCFLFLQISILCYFGLLVNYRINLLNKSNLLTVLSSWHHGSSSLLSGIIKTLGERGSFVCFL